jgi:hypothetical protein
LCPTHFRIKISKHNYLGWRNLAPQYICISVFLTMKSAKLQEQLFWIQNRKFGFSGIVVSGSPRKLGFRIRALPIN